MPVTLKMTLTSTKSSKRHVTAATLVFCTYSRSVSEMSATHKSPRLDKRYMFANGMAISKAMSATRVGSAHMAKKLRRM